MVPLKADAHETPKLCRSDKMKAKKVFSEIVQKFADISMKWLLKNIKVEIDITSEPYPIDWANYIQKIWQFWPILQARQWLKNTCQGESKYSLFKYIATCWVSNFMIFHEDLNGIVEF